ncbi:phage tail tape measure protein [Myroides fluvii]|uniref:phage tail tape measure protein n=1 Tax=Myroides fluvii TaxID=2572594 RepID=UPI00131DA1B4|nr:phage tail tape measure protein [Myroides fluvii]
MADVKRNIYIEINGKQVTNSLSGLRSEIRNVERDIRNLNRNDKDYQETLRQHQQRLQAVRNEYAAARDELGQTPSLLQNIKNELGEVGTGMLKAFTVTAVIGSFVNGVKSAFNTIKEFDQAQADLAGILETTKLGVIGLTFEAIKLGAKLPFTSTEVSRAQLELAKLGKSMDEIKNMTPGVLNAAIAMDSELAPAAELVAGQLNSYAEGSAQAGKYADILSNSTNISATSFEYLSTALPKVSKAAAVANVSFEKLNATLGVLSDENIAAETSGTSFRNILLIASKEGVHYEKLLERVKNSTNQLSTATELFGTQNAIVAVTLANSTDKIQRQTEALENSSGSAEKLAAEKMNSIEGDLKLFDSAIEGFILGIEKGDGAIGNFTRGIIQFGTSLIGLITPTRNVTDELFEQQMAINELISKITSSNIKEGERLDLLKELKANYPEYISQIDIEKVSNEELLTVLKDINKNYRERIALQVEAEKADEFRNTRDTVAKGAAKLESDLVKKLGRVVRDHNLDFVVDTSNVEKSAKEVMKILKDTGKSTFLFSDYSNIKTYLKDIEMLRNVEQDVNVKLQEQMVLVDEKAKKNNLVTEAEREANAEKLATLKEQIKVAKELGGIEGKDFNASEIESVQRYIIAKQGELDVENQVAEKKKELSEKEIQRSQRELEQKKKIFESGEKAIDDLLLQSVKNRELALLSGIDRDIKAVELKYEREKQKYAEHTDRMQQLDAAKNEEIAQIKLLKAKEYQEQIDALEEENIIRKRENELQRYADNIVDEDERALAMLEKTKVINDLELQLQMDKEISKIENVENSESLIEAIKQKYATKKEAIELGLAEREKQIGEAKVKKEKELEDQKLGVIKGAFNSASELFNQGSSAWKATKIAETTIDTYQAASKALAAYPPPFSYIAMAASIAVGLKNVQKIASTKVPKMPSYYYGGPTGSGNPSLGGDQYGAYTGMTHADEWVAPAFMTQNPRYASTFQWLENERKQTLRGESTNNTTDNQLSSAAIALAAATMQLNEVLAVGIEAKANIGYKEINKMNQLNEDMNQSSKYSKVQ